MNEMIHFTKQRLTEELWKADPQIHKILRDAASLFEARENLFEYLNKLERHYYNIHSAKTFKDFHVIEKKNATECIRVLKNVIRTENEIHSGTSSLKVLYTLALGNSEQDASEAFLAEFLFLFRGINAQSGIIREEFILPSDSKRASLKRSCKLDEYSGRIRSNIRKYKSGLDPAFVRRRQKLRKAILRHFKASEADWNDHRWQLRHILKDLDGMQALVNLSDEEEEGLKTAMKHHIPFQVTPYYLSLFNPDGRCRDDRAIRAQVLPTRYYCEKVVNNRTGGIDMDFMGERSTSPIEGITRRYPGIVILKPVDVCPQICVYCQRNWEIKPLKESGTSRNTITKALEWIRGNQNICEVLITGGDPFILPDEYLEFLIAELSRMEHIERIRIGTRVPVTLPMRITPSLVNILKRHHRPGKREVCVVTHFEHPSEITSEAVKAVSRIRKAGISIYNQQVFTYFNSARYESAALRKTLKLAGIDPYYTFNTKGKEETADFRVPIARIEQERKEEARFLPGLVRTDEPVFNVPRLGKSHLRAWQDHEIIMIRPSGERVYRFYPWESKVTLVNDYLYDDVPIFNYLKKLKKDEEDLEEYRSIWYYF